MKVFYNRRGRKSFSVRWLIHSCFIWFGAKAFKIISERKRKFTKPYTTQGVYNFIDKHFRHFLLLEKD